MKSEKNPNQRQDPRRTSYIIATYTVKEGMFRDIIRNIGPSGMFINTRRGIAENQDIQLTFPLFQFDRDIKVSGRVVRTNANGFAVLFDATISDLIGNDGQLLDIVHEINRGSSED